jgi:carbon monoxide dehydrogenase subunit G
VGAFTVRREVAAPAEVVWARLVDWPAHGRWVPLTTVRVTSAGPAGVGMTFVGRTGVGPVGFDDPMTVTRWQPPADGREGRCTVRKTGRVVLGGADVTVRPLTPTRCTVEWTETADVVGLRRLPLAGRVTAWVGALAFGRVLARMAAEVEPGAAGSTQSPGPQAPAGPPAGGPG